MNVVAIIQARMGSSRLPGKVMLPLAGEHVLTQVIERVEMAASIDNICVATSDNKKDDIIERYSKKADANVFRGSESDVLSRMYNAAVSMEADIVVRVTADCPLVSPDITDEIVKKLRENSADYVSTKLERTFPRAVGVAAFTINSFSIVEQRSEKEYEREHVTPYYHENKNEFDLINVVSDDIFENEKYIGRTDIRVTLDEADDYELLRRVYEDMEFDELLDIKKVIRYIDEHNLTDINENVTQKTLSDNTDG